MASFRQRTGGTWEVVVKRKIIPGKGYVSETFATKELGATWSARLESLLDAGIVPDELKGGDATAETLDQLIRGYLHQSFVPHSDSLILGAIINATRGTVIKAIDLAWIEHWIQGMKVERNSSPVTIRHYVGALRRCFDWAARKKIPMLLVNPIRLLPTRYALYSPQDIQLGKATNRKFVERLDVERDRRLTEVEMKNIARVMNRENIGRRQRPLDMKRQGATELMWTGAATTSAQLLASMGRARQTKNTLPYAKLSITVPLHLRP